VKRPGLRVRSRKGFFGTPSIEPAAAPGGEGAGVLEALSSPFSAADIAVRVTCLFGQEPKAPPKVRILVHADVSGLTLEPEADGGLRATLEMVVMAFGGDGRVVGQQAQEHRIRIEPAYVEAARKGGIVHVTDLLLDKPGGLQVRVAVRDVASGRLGSASQFLEVPDLRKGRLALSGIVMSGEASGGGAPDPDASPAVRRFRRGSSVSYAFFVYNPHVPRAPALPQVEVRSSLLREGREIVGLPPRGVDAVGQPDPQRLPVGGAIQVAPGLEAGSYSLQVVATDRLRKGDDALALQWIDFEVVD
jgi:hypothetical protein